MTTSRPKIWIVQGTHWHVPGTVMKACVSAIAAAACAAELVNDLRGEVDLPADATASDHEAKLQEARKAKATLDGFEHIVDDQFSEEEQIDRFLSDDDADVWVTELPVEGSAPSTSRADYLGRFPVEARSHCDRAYQDGYVDGANSEPDDNLPPLKPRRPLQDDEPDGYAESDMDYLRNNSDLAVALLDQRNPEESR